MNNYTKNQYDLIEACRTHMAENELACLEPILPDSKIHRYSADGRRKKSNEWYIAHEGIFNDTHYLTCIYGSWSTGARHVFKSYDKTNISDQERNHLENEYIKRKIAADQTIKELQNNAAIIAKKIWDEASEVPLEHHLYYPKSKGIQPIGAKFVSFDNRIILPLKNIYGQIRSIQFIYISEDGKSNKRFLPDGEKKGNFHVLGELKSNLSMYVVEGWATGVSVYMAGLGPVIIAFDSGNIEPVVEKLKEKFPQNEIIIAGDNDEVGKQKANTAAKNFGCKSIFPEFPEHKKFDANGKAYTDFNDLHQICGLDEVKKQLRSIEIIKVAQADQLRDLANILLKKEDPCIDFSVDGLPITLGDYINAICKTTDAHPIMITMSVLTTISAFLGKRVSYPYYFQPLYPNLWMLAIAKSGQFKSTALNKGASIAWKRHDQVTTEIKEIENKIRTTTNSTEKLKLEEERLAISLTDVILPTKITGEALLEHLSQGHTGVILASEFRSFLLNLTKNQNNDLKPLFTDLYDVPIAYRYKTKTQGDLILKEPCFSICGVSTLTWIKDNIKVSDVSSGFFARFLIFTPTHQDKIPLALPLFDHEFNKLIEEENKLISLLNQVNNPHIFNPLSGDAKVFFEAIHKKIYEMPQSYSDRSQEILEPYLKRWSPYLLKLAMIMQIIEDPNSKEISANAVLAGVSILLAAIKSTMHLFEGELGESDHQRKCRSVFEWICKKVKKTGLPVKRQALLTSKQLEGGTIEYDYILNSLIEQNKILYEQKDKKNETLYWPNETEN